MNSQNLWTDDPCFYVSVVDGKRFNLLAGPFKTHEEAKAIFEKTREEALKVGGEWAWFYSYGTVKMINGYREGLLNGKLGI